MPTLAIRPLNPLDIPAMRHVRQRLERLDMPDASDVALPRLPRQFLATLPARLRQEHVFIALVDGELCAYVSLRPQAARYRWDVLALAAGSPRLDATDDVCVELWTALLEYSVRRAGEAGAKRLFATSDEDTPASWSLRGAGFERYSTFTIFVGRAAGQSEPPDGMRRQEDSDVWSIHQLYHQVTPRAVQFAEALTSSVWELPSRSPIERATGATRDAQAFVVETVNGVQAYCQVTRRGGGAMARLLVSDACRSSAMPLALAAAERAGVSTRERLRVLLPGHARELGTAFESAGFTEEIERVALVRHTTAPVFAQTRTAPLAIESGERVPRGVPTYVRNARRAPARPGGVGRV